MSPIIQANDSPAFIETECAFEFQGHTLTAGGAHLLQRRDTGKWEAILYARQVEVAPGRYRYEVTVWDGSQVWPAVCLGESQNICGRFRTLRTSKLGMPLQGRWFYDSGDIVRLREVKEC